MLFCLGVSVLLGHAKVDDVNEIGILRVGSPNQKVVRLDISVDQVLFVDGLDAIQLQGHARWIWKSIQRGEDEDRAEVMKRCEHG